MKGSAALLSSRAAALWAKERLNATHTATASLSSGAATALRNTFDWFPPASAALLPGVPGLLEQKAELWSGMHYTLFPPHQLPLSAVGADGHRASEAPPGFSERMWGAESVECDTRLQLSENTAMQLRRSTEEVKETHSERLDGPMWVVRERWEYLAKLNGDSGSGGKRQRKSKADGGTPAQDSVAEEAVSGKKAAPQAKRDVPVGWASLATSRRSIIYHPPLSASVRQHLAELEAQKLDDRERGPVVATAHFNDMALWRFSALTYNAHRIHWDLQHSYAAGFSGLVVHGPLLAMFSVSTAEALWGASAGAFKYRLHSPLCIPTGKEHATLELHVNMSVDEVATITGWDPHTQRIIITATAWLPGRKEADKFDG